jgi:4-amino-4-deoxy-L-arabinose transferase-like glycosyltransferase
MSFLSPTLDRFERDSGRFIDKLAARPRLAAAVLLALALFTYLPGVLLLPPVDRTEVVYAQSSRDMIKRHDLIDATFEGERFAFRPIGIYWLQYGAGKLLGSKAQHVISTYRLPSLIAGVLAVLAMWWLLRPVLGDRRSIIAAGLFAVSPIVALQASLSIPEGPLLLSIVVAQCALLRLYCASDADDGTIRWLALAFWVAQGLGILLNALSVPLLSLSTLVALYIFDRRIGWLKRLQPLWGVPLVLAIAAPWLAIRAHFDGGIPFSELSFVQVFHALTGAQDMKWKAAPLSFTLATLLGFMPGALLIVPAIRGLWDARAGALQRFLFCWIVGHWAFLELIVSEPALYTVQALFPALGAAVALALDKDGRLAIPPLSLRLPWWIVLPGTAALFPAILYVSGTAPSAAVILGAALITLLFTVGTLAMRDGRAAAWVTSSIAGFALFVSFTFAILMPHIEMAWPAPRIAEAIAPLRRCVTGPVGVVGFREPSTTFVLGHDSDTNAGSIAGWMAGGDDAIAVVEDRFQPDLAKALEARSATAPLRVGCVEAFNVMRGCTLHFSIYATGPDPLDPNCKVAERFACSRPVPTTTEAGSRCR